MTDAALAGKLESIVGPRFVLRRESDLLVYNSDGLALPPWKLDPLATVGLSAQ